MIPRSFSATSCVLEVERKFRCLAVRELTTNIGSPPFQSIQSLGQQTISDVYYDRANLLSSAGVWVRRRNAKWEAKIRIGGDFINSRFEELSDPHAIARCIKDIAGTARTEQQQFGLERVAAFTTTREAWIADNEFRIVLDSMDFGHTVGEVELQQHKTLVATSSTSVEQEKQKIMQHMDSRIARFMEQYAWAFCPGIPKGKLTAYFERTALARG
ncbi:uncharacterized protein K460DRAFT_182317 [Cucurbitaria berberidis CBS 394.84]|uniref:Thiamine-triphosphatase n=1 Tax=Cucurbitaria berberidis CBS 394.84 TaxID=1168544 RepID=A0A9P4GAQ6_9PLEO|nr:uncharacterized protein K460DRAFT_182317 [Cucurbitaria berberidis CBS 394.84]KAF1842323.1 hypothetical protein K460DRAFT_182317 [Cucurbitaria berberidis CBS 394.84]